MSSTATKHYDFEGKVAIVTGSSSGIGEAVAILLASYGAKVTVTGRSEENVKRVALECERVSPKHHVANTVVGNLTDEQTVRNIVQSTVDKFGQIDILVNNAGSGRPAGFDDDNLMDSYDYTMLLNVRSVLYTIKLAQPYLAKTKGNIVNVSSIAAYKPFPNFTTYSMSKAALDMLTKSSAVELGTKGIRVNSINPGPIETNIARDFNLDSLKQPIKPTNFIDLTVAGRIGKPVECAHMVAYLASENAAYVTGVCITIDGGLTVKS